MNGVQEQLPFNNDAELEHEAQWEHYVALLRKRPIEKWLEQVQDECA